MREGLTSTGLDEGQESLFKAPDLIHKRCQLIADDGDLGGRCCEKGRERQKKEHNKEITSLKRSEKLSSTKWRSARACMVFSNVICLSSRQKVAR